LRRAGVVVPRRRRDQAGVPDGFRRLGVTQREMDVLDLLADRLSNREIGERLTLSPRTVEKHVERLMAKTDATSRAELTLLARTYVDRHSNIT
jgi:DNA-binding NarL/FixJ family response regulator